MLNIYLLNAKKTTKNIHRTSKTYFYNILNIEHYLISAYIIINTTSDKMQIYNKNRYVIAKMFPFKQATNKQRFL